MEGQLPSYLWDLFICYRRKDGFRLATQLRRKLITYKLPQKLGERSKRALRVYQDTAYERATEDFWRNTVLPALEASRYLGIVLTPAVMEPGVDGQPNWVEREIAAFSSIPQGNNIFILDPTGVAEGQLPGELHKKFPNIQRIDLRGLRRQWKTTFNVANAQDSVLSVAATLYDVLPEEMPILRQEEERRKRRAAVLTAGVSLALLIIVSVLALGWRGQRNIARTEREIATKQAQIAEARQMAAQASLFVRDDPSEIEHGVLLATASLSGFPTFEADLAIRQNLPLLRKQVALLDHGEGQGVLALAFSPNSQLLATGSLDTFAHVFDVPSGREITKLKHGDTVWKVAFSRGGRYLATASYDKTARVFDTTSWEELIKGEHGSKVCTVAFSPDEKYVATGTEMGEFQLIEVASKKQLLKTPADESGSGVATVAFSPNGDYLILATGFRTTVLNTHTLKPEWIAKALFNSPPLVAFSPDGRLFAAPDVIAESSTVAGQLSHPRLHDIDTSAGTNVIRVRRSDSYKPVLALSGKYDYTSLAFSQDSKLIATGNRDGTARVYDIRQAREVAAFSLERPVETVAISPNGRYLLIGGEDNTARVFEVLTGKETARLTHKDQLKAAVFSPNGRYMATASMDGTAKIFDFYGRDNVVEKYPVEEHSWWRFSPDGKYLAGAGVPSTLVGPLSQKGASSLEEAPRGAASPQLEEQFDPVAFSPGGRYVAEDYGGTARLLELATGATKDLPILGSHALAFSPDGQFLAAGGDGGVIDFMNISNNTGKHFAKVFGRELTLDFLPRKEKVIEASVQALAFSPDGRYIASGGSSGIIEAFESNTGQRAYTLETDQPGSVVLSLAFSSDGSYLGVVMQGLTTMVFDLSTKKQLWQVGHGTVLFPAFSPDSRYISIASEDNTARILDVKSGKELTRIPLAGSVQAVMFTSDGRYLLAASTQQPKDRKAEEEGAVLSISKYPLMPEDLREWVCAVASRNLTQNEWHESFPEKSLEPHFPCPNLP